MLIHLPLFILLLIAYNIGMMLFADINAALSSQVFSTHLISGAQWSLNTSDIFIIFGLVALYIEVIKATGIGLSSVLDHTFSTLVFVIFLVEFLVVEGCGTSTFFTLTLMSLFDIISGFTVSITAARRDLAIGPHQ